MRFFHKKDREIANKEPFSPTQTDLSDIENEENIRKPVDEKVLQRATEKLMEYKSGKANLERRLIAHEEFWKMRQWSSAVSEAYIAGENPAYKVHSTPWLHTCIEARIADAMDSYPTCNFLPRQADDEEEAKNLSQIVPVIMARNGFDSVYSNAVRYCLNHGAMILGVFWDSAEKRGLGDISIKDVDALNLFWEPGIKNIQDSSNVFYTVLMDNDAIERMYPQTEGNLNGSNTFTAKYRYDDTVDTSGKSLVIDWYYHKMAGNKKVLHYCKYVNDIVLFSSENEGMKEGYYLHGEYPFVMEPLYPVEGSPFGYGLVDIGETTQLQIDILNKAIIDNAAEGSRPRYLASADNTINEKELSDPTKRIVHCEGSVDEEHLRPITTSDLPGIYVTYLNNMIEQLKFCTANQDVNNGVAPSGVTAASALAALQETSGKNPRNANRSFHRCYKKAVYLVIENIRQFYSAPRQFRISTEKGQNKYVTYSNEKLVAQPQSVEGNMIGERIPEFDIEVTVEKANPYKKMEHNELILQLFGLGVFNPQNVDQSMALLNHLDFEGKDKVIQTVEKNASMLDLLLQYQQIALSLAQAVDPSLADRLAQTIVSSDMGATVMSAANVDLKNTQEGAEHPFVEKSRAQARASTQAD